MHYTCLSSICLTRAAPELRMKSSWKHKTNVTDTHTMSNSGTVVLFEVTITRPHTQFGYKKCVKNNQRYNLQNCVNVVPHCTCIVKRSKVTRSPSVRAIYVPNSRAKWFQIQTIYCKYNRQYHVNVKTATAMNAAYHFIYIRNWYKLTEKK